MSNKPKSNPLPLDETLRDLAVLRATDVDLSELLPQSVPLDSESDVYHSVDKSYEFVKEARDAMKMYNRGKVEKQGERVEELRSKLEDVLKGLAAHEKGGLDSS